MEQEVSTTEIMDFLKEHMMTKAEGQELRDNMMTKTEGQELRDIIMPRNEFMEYLEENMMTKEDGQELRRRMMTKEDGQKIQVELDELTSKVFDMDARMDTFATKDDLMALKDGITRQIDDFLKLHNNHDTELAALKHGHSRHEERIENLEKKAGLATA